MKKLYNSFFFIAFLVLSALSASGCSNKLGYGVVNWSIPEHNLTAADVVPVLVRSNISQVYIVELNDQKIEIPLWQLTFCSSKREVQQYIEKTSEYRSVYAVVKRDGLPLRSAPDNTGKQVYRLRENQTVKILWKGEGAPVTAHDRTLEGDWLYVMTNDGSKGWCFSYNLYLYDESEPSVPQKKTETAVDPALQEVLKQRWYPDYYRDMIDKKQIDPIRMAETFGFFAGETSGLVRISLQDEHISFPYTGITKNKMGSYRFEGSPVLLQIRDDGTIAVNYTDEKGLVQTRRFITLKENPTELVQAELERRHAILEQLIERGPVFNSGNYGVIQFITAERFLWNGYQVLSPLIIPKGAGASGAVAIRYLLGSNLKNEYQGVLSFKFDEADTWRDFFYTLSVQGLKLEYVKPENIKDGIAATRNVNPVILFFGAEGYEE